jgi:ABC-2 type transport system permease protein
MIVYCAAGIIMAVGALLIYRKRKLETASDVVAVRVLKPVLRGSMAFGSALVFGLIMYNIISPERGHTITLLILMLIGSFLGYFVSEMLMKKSFRVFKRWPTFVVYALIIAIAVLGLGYNLFGLSSWVPEASEVQSLRIGPMVDVELTDKEDISAVIDIHRHLTGEKEEALSYGNDLVYTVLEYKLTNGRTVSRQYPMRYSEADYKGSDAEALDRIINRVMAENLEKNKEITDKSIMRCSVEWFDGSEYKNMELTRAQAYQLYKNCIIPDALEARVNLAYVKGFPNNSEYTIVYIDYNEKEENGIYSYKSLVVWLTDDTSRTKTELDKLKNGNE